MDIVNPDVEAYLRDLLGGDHPIADEMEAEARERDFPIVDRIVGVTLEMQARSIGARRVLELGSGYGYSAYWFARAVGDGGEVHMTDSDPANAERAADYLGRAGLAERTRSHVGMALDLMDDIDGELDIVFSDIMKHEYPEAWRKASERIRIGGLYLCDNVLWSGRVAVDDPDDEHPDWTEAVREHNRLVATDRRFVSTIVPTRDGVTVALRIG